MDQPQLVILAGPNGAGKTTASERILRGVIPIEHFVNADTIARGLSARSPESVAMEAGRIMLKRLDELVESRQSFAFETTLSSRTFVHLVKRAQSGGYQATLLYFWLPSPEVSINRVRDRVRRGGHHVPDDDIRRRYGRGLSNFFQLYRLLVDRWRFYDNTGRPGRLIARQSRTAVAIVDPILWAQLQAQYESGIER